MDEVLAFLKEVKTYYIATVDGDQPRNRPFGTIVEFEGKLYFQTGRSKAVSRQLHANPKFEICAFNKGQWIRVAGKAYADERIEAQEAVLAEYPGLRERYQPGDGNNEVFYMEDVTATISSFTDGEKVFTF